MQPLDAVAVLSALASDQFGLVTSAQAREHGVGGAMLRRLLDASVLLPVARGVYRAAAAPEPAHLEIIVAWLRLDPARAAWRRDGRGRDDAVVSHKSACVLIGLGELPHPRVELTVPRRRRTLDPAVRLHVRIGAIEPDDLTVACGLPVTTAARTIADLLRESADGGHVGGVIAAAADRGLVDPVVLGDRVAVFAGRYGMRGARGTRLSRRSPRKREQLSQAAGSLRAALPVARTSAAPRPSTITVVQNTRDHRRPRLPAMLARGAVRTRPPRRPVGAGAPDRDERLVHLVGAPILPFGFSTRFLSCGVKTSIGFARRVREAGYRLRRHQRPGRPLPAPADQRPGRRRHRPRRRGPDHPAVERHGQEAGRLVPHPRARERDARGRGRIARRLRGPRHLRGVGARRRFGVAAVDLGAASRLSLRVARRAPITPPRPRRPAGLKPDSQASDRELPVHVTCDRTCRDTGRVRVVDVLGRHRLAADHGCVPAGRGVAAAGCVLRAPRADRLRRHRLDRLSARLGEHARRAERKAALRTAVQPLPVVLRAVTRGLDQFTAGRASLSGRLPPQTTTLRRTAGVLGGAASHDTLKRLAKSVRAYRADGTPDPQLVVRVPRWFIR